MTKNPNYDLTFMLLENRDMVYINNRQAIIEKVQLAMKRGAIGISAIGIISDSTCGNAKGTLVDTIRDAMKLG